MNPQLVIFGNLAVDDVVYADGSTRMGQAGGAVVYAALGASLWGLEVGLVSRVGEDYPRALLESLEARHFHLDGVRPIAGAGLRTWLLYEGELRRVVHRLDSISHLEASPTLAELPSGWSPRAFHIAPLPIDRQRDLVTDLSRDTAARISLDPYALIRSETQAAWRELTSGLDWLFVSEDELADRRWRQDPVPLLAQLASERLRLVFLKQGSRGGRLFELASRRDSTWQGRAATVTDLTGAGDAFAGGALAGLLTGDDTAGAVARGIVSASFALQDLGARGLLAATPKDAGERLTEWFPDGCVTWR